MKIFKNLIIINLLISVLLCFSSCSCSLPFKKNDEIDILTSDIADEIKNKIVFKDELQEIDDMDMLQNIYTEINPDYISEFSVYISSSGATAEESAVFKINDLTYSDDIKQIFVKRRTEQISSFENYIPEEVYKLENSVINETKNIFTFVACDTPDDVEILLKKLYTNK